MPDVPPTDKSYSYRLRQTNGKMNRRDPMAVSSGFDVMGVLPPHPDTNDFEGTLFGSWKRCFHAPPPCDPQLLNQFSQFVLQWCENKLKPLEATTDISLETMLDDSGYPESRKVELRDAWKPVSELLALPANHKSKRVDQFVKDEFYELYKHFRMINARCDTFKASVGPVFKVIEHEIFRNPAFIKKVPVTDRPEYICKRIKMEGGLYMETDYSSFESLFTPQLMRSCEMVMYKYMSSELEGGTEWYSLIEQTLTGTNHIRNKYFKAWVDGKRMSGEMNTSLGNGFSNLMIMKFVLKKQNIKGKGIVEGDDGLFVVSKRPNMKMFLDMGLELKFDFMES